MMKQMRDQSVHMAVCLVALLPLAIQPSIWTGILAGFVCGMIREVTEEGAPVTLSKIGLAMRSWQDLNYWTSAGAIAGIVGSWWRA